MAFEKIAVLGAGNAGYAMSADLALAGHKVNLYEMPRFKQNLEPILERGGIEKMGRPTTGFARLDSAMTDIKEAIEGVSHIMVVTQALAHRTIAELCAPHLENGQTVVLFTGSAGSLVFAKALKERVDIERKEVVIAETITMPYGCRRGAIVALPPYAVRVDNVSAEVDVAAFPAKNTEKVVHSLNEIYKGIPSSTFVSAPNVLYVGLNNPNIVEHAGSSLLNVGRIEYSKGDFKLYEEGLTPSVVRVLNAVDGEKCAILKALNLKPITREEILSKSIINKPREKYKGPVSVKDRYVTEDVPIGLVLMASLGDMLGVSTPTTKSIIHLFSVINQVDYMREGRTVEKLGISELSVDELNRFLMTGSLM